MRLNLEIPKGSAARLALSFVETGGQNFSEGSSLDDGKSPQRYEKAGAKAEDGKENSARWSARQAGAKRSGKVPGAGILPEKDLPEVERPPG